MRTLALALAALTVASTASAQSPPPPPQVDALGFAQLLSSPQVNDPNYYTQRRLETERMQGEQRLAQQSSQARQTVGRMIEAGYCKDALNYALQIGDIELAREANNLCAQH